ncbi:MAG: HU family DNA-binding protein [Bacteroidaceae bacterium]|nr:HU family DNA-binding protein [Bacteroidaceae bacterium]
MNNKEFISALSHEVELSVKDTQNLTNSLLAELTSQLEDGNTIVIQNFGAFEVKKKLERVVINPSTGQRMLVPPKLALNFKSSTGLKERMQKGGES